MTYLQIYIFKLSEMNCVNLSDASFSLKFCVHSTDRPLSQRCPSMTHTFRFLNRVWVNAALCKVYSGVVNQTRFAQTVIYCTDLLHLAACNSHTRYIINQVCVIDGLLGLNVCALNVHKIWVKSWHRQISNSVQ